jgi:sensor c-di-GMP phosphodiesterase-like protein
LFRSRKKLLVAAAVGVLLAGAPVVAFDMWIEQVAEQHGAEDIAAAAGRTVAIIDGRLGDVVEGLDSLVAQGVANCNPADIEKLRRTLFTTSPAKEFSVIGPDGQTRCSDLGLSPSARKIVNVPRAATAGEVVTEVVRLADRPVDYLRVRRFLASGGSLAALVPSDVLIPLAATRGGPFAAHARVFTADGALIGEGGRPLATDVPASDVVSATRRSDRFGIKVTVAALKESVEPTELRAIGRTVNSVAALGLLALALLLWFRRGGDPVNEIKRALVAHQLVPYFQPIIDITSGRLLGAEVLARWRRRDGTVLLPASFMPLVEQSGLMVEMTQSLMRRTSVEIGDAYAKRPHLKVAFNLTARQFASDAIVADLREIFDRSKISLSQVTLELTEREPIEDMEATRRVVAALQGLGCRVALDDVGTGHSGLSSILKLGIDAIKIDKFFIDSLRSDRNSATIVATMVELARNMRMEVVAEGVESFEQVADLRARGVRAAQGYVFAPPLPASGFLTLLESLDPLVGKPAALPAPLPKAQAGGQAA